MSQYFSKDHNQPVLKAIPYLKQPHRLIKLEYPHNSIKKIQPTFYKAVNLQYIDLSHNQIYKIDVLFCMKKLRFLNLSYNNINDIGQGVCNMISLKQLDLSYNCISKVKSLFYVSELYKNLNGNLNINIEGNQILKTQAKAALQLFQLEKFDQTKQLDISPPFQKDSTQVGGQGSWETNKSLQTRKKLHYSILVSKQDELNKKNQSLLIGSQKSLECFMQTKKQEHSKHYPNEYLSNLNQLQNKFKVFNNINELKNNELIGQSYIHICVSSLNCIQLLKSLIQLSGVSLSSTSNNLQNFQEKYDKFQIQISQSQQLIKEQHQKILQKLNKSEQIPTKFYSAWVHTYRRLREIKSEVINSIKTSVKQFIRRRQIQELSVISPQKNDQKDNKYSEQNQDKSRLEGLLFSKKKKSEQDSSKKQTDCEECLIKSQQIKIMEQQLSKIKAQNQINIQRIGSLQRQNLRLTKYQKHLGQGLIKNQQIIINQIGSIKPCDFQYIMLNQAKGIQNLIKAGVSISQAQNSVETFRNIGKHDGKTQCRTNQTHKPVPISEKGVSQFMYSSNKTPQTHSALSKKFPYFNQKQQDVSHKVSRKYTQNSLDSTQKKQKRKSQRLQSKNSIKQKKKYEEASHKTNDNINKINDQNIEYVTQFIASQPASKQIYDRSQKNIKQTGYYNSNQNKYQNSNQNKQNNPSIYINRKLGTMHYLNEKYQPKTYSTINLKDQQNYQKYIKNHLRNSIIQVLNNKGKRTNSIQKVRNKSDKNKLYCSILHPTHTNNNNTNNNRIRNYHERSISNQNTNRVRSHSDSVIKNRSVTKNTDKIIREKSSPKFIF